MRYPLLEQHILSKSEVSEKSLKAFSELLQIKKLAKQEFFIMQGERTPSIAFVLSGVLCSYAIDPHGDKHVIQFAQKGHWISDLSAFFSGDPAIFNVQAIAESELLLLHKHNFETACDEIEGFERFFRILIQNAYISFQKRVSRIYMESVENRYLQLLEKSPDIFELVPQHHYFVDFLQTFDSQQLV